MGEPNKKLSENANPPETDLDYFSRPENYTGTNLQAMQLVFLAKKEDKSQIQEKKKKLKDAKYHFFHRYKHIMKEMIFIDDLMEPEEESDEEEEKVEEEKREKEPIESREEAHSPKISTQKKCLKIVQEEEEDKETIKKKAEEEARGTESNAVSPDRDYSPDKGQLATGVSMELESDMSVKSGGGTRQSLAIMKAKISSVAKDLQRKQLRLKFKKYVRLVLMVVRLMSASNKETGADIGGFRTFMDIASEGEKTLEKMKNQGLSFDPSYYKSKKEISLSTEVKNALQMPPEKRTPEMVQTVMFGLQCLKSFAEYPLHMQEKLAKVAWYDVVPPKKIIIRQGQSAENFYFILTGHAVVTILIRDPKTGQSFNKTATVMKRGMSFGELALLHHSKRTATVTSQDTVQLLSIGREDFFDIFMSGQGPDNMPEHIRFISQLDFMKDWPIQNLLEHSEKCLLHFFKRNTVIVKDSNNSEWVYVVKTGSCQVLKQLKGVTATLKYKPKADPVKMAELRSMVLVFQPKIDTGLRRRKKKEKERKEKKEEKTETLPSTGTGDKKTFSKEAYVQKPDIKSAYLQVCSAFAKRKRYKPPRRSIPKKHLPPPVTIAPKKPVAVFLQVTNLNRKDAFGLDTIVFQDDVIRPQTSVSLVSQGAELVMLSKAFYVKHANELVKRRIRYTISPFPDEETFQENLQIKEDWILYKKSLLEDLTSRL